MTTDVADAANDTTLGPYSFRVFVDCAWTKLHAKTLTVVGRRKEEPIGGGKRKRPKTADWKVGKRARTATKVREDRGEVPDEPVTSLVISPRILRPHT